MKIAHKLGLLVAAFLVTILTTILLLSSQIASTSSEYDSLIGHQIKQRAAARTMLVVFGQQVIDFQQILLDSKNAEEYAPLKKTYDHQVAAVRTLTSQLLANVGPEDPRLRTSLLEFRSTHAAVTTQFQAALDGFVRSKYTDITGASDAVRGQEKFPNDLVTYIVSYRQRSVDALVVDQRASVSLRIKLIYGVSGLLLLLAAAAMTAVVRSVVRPIRSLTSAALDAANNRLPKVVAQIATLPAEAQAPALPQFQVTTKDELRELASALTTLQDSAVELALEQRRNEEANAETLVNLGRRNQSLLTRMLSYVTELERNERDSEVLDKLFRLDHLTTRIRRNAESLLVLAGAKQTRTWSQPIAIDDVLRASLSEIEEYTRVTIHHADHALVHGGVAADLTHLLAELLENATRFSPGNNQVLVVGRLTPGGYQFDLVDSGLGMEAEELQAANLRFAEASQRRPDTKVLGHHVVSQIAARRGILVRLLPSDQAGITAQVLVPISLLSDAVIPATVHQITTVPPISPAPQAARAQVPIRSAAPEPRRPDPVRPQPPSRAPGPAAAPALAPVGTATARPGRRVRGAQLGSLSDSEYQDPPTRVDAAVVRSQMSALQSGVAAARGDYYPQPIANPPGSGNDDRPPTPIRRVRGAQLAELGAETEPDEPRPARDALATGRQLSGLQAGANRARLEAGRSPVQGDDAFERNA
jgi:hypothetical protein